jgi:hypothetical protein
MQSSRDIHNQLMEFPIFNKPERHPIDTSQPFVRGGTFHDLITVNLMSLVPNIDIGCNANKTPEDMKQWITLARIYSAQINDEFQRQCDKQEAHLRLIENQKTRCQDLTMTDINKYLPDDVINTIYEFLLPETKIQFFLAKYPLYDTTLQNNLNTNQLKRLLRISRDQFYMGIPPNLRKNVTRDYTLYGGLNQHVNKTTTATVMTTLFNTLRNAQPNTPENHCYFQTKSLKLLKLMIYLGYHYKKAPRRRRAS